MSMIVILTFYYVLYDNFNVIGVLSNTNNMSTWEDLDNRPLPQWYESAKIGIFIHWGVYSVPSFKDELFWYHWQSGDEEVDNFMKKYYSQVLAYEDFVPMFKAEKFDPDEWAQLFRKSGAKYVVLTVKHKDGYTLFPTKRLNWNSIDAGPKRDIVFLLAKSIRQNGLKFGVHYCLMEWFNNLYLKELKTQGSSTVYTDTIILPDIKYLVNMYKPSVLWVNGDQYARCDYWKSQELLSWLYQESTVKGEIVVNDRWSACARGQHGDFYSFQNYEKMMPHKWENAFPLDKLSWGYRRNMEAEDVMSFEELLRKVVSTVSYGGNVLINIGPTKDGIIVPEFRNPLLKLGSWLKVNGEAIYDTSPWLYQKDSLNPAVWYTCVNGEYLQNGTFNETVHTTKIVYAIFLSWPVNNRLKIADLTSYLIEEEIKIYLIKHGDDLKDGDKQDKKRLKRKYVQVNHHFINDTVDIVLPRVQQNMNAWVLKIEFTDK